METTELLEKYDLKAEKLTQMNRLIKDQQALFCLAMEDFIVELIKERFPQIKDFDCQFYFQEATIGCDWADENPTTEVLNKFLDELNKHYKFNKL